MLGRKHWASPKSRGKRKEKEREREKKKKEKLAGSIKQTETGVFTAGDERR